MPKPAGCSKSSDDARSGGSCAGLNRCTLNRAAYRRARGPIEARHGFKFFRVGRNRVLFRARYRQGWVCGILNAALLCDHNPYMLVTVDLERLVRMTRSHLPLAPYSTLLFLL